MENKQIAATQENIETAINSIKEFATSKGYQIIGEFKNDQPLRFESASKEKVFRKYLWKISQKVSMPLANKLLHFLYKKVYGLSEAPRVEYSDKELKIKAARKAWKKAQLEADRLMAEYKTEKGDFYKK